MAVVVVVGVGVKNVPHIVPVLLSSQILLQSRAIFTKKLFNLCTQHISARELVTGCDTRLRGHAQRTSFMHMGQVKMPDIGSRSEW